MRDPISCTIKGCPWRWASGQSRPCPMHQRREHDTARWLGIRPDELAELRQRRAGNARAGSPRLKRPRAG